MAKKNDTTNLTELLLRCMGEADPMLSMLEWLCAQLMEAEVSNKLGAEKNEHCNDRTSSRSGYRPRRYDTRMGTMYLLIPKVRNGGYIPFFVTERKRSEVALIQVVQEAFVQGVSTRKMDKVAKSLGIENLSRSQVGEMSKGLNEQALSFRERPLAGKAYPVLWVDALYEKVCYGGHVVSVIIQIVCGVNVQGRREVLAIESVPEESKDTYRQLFEDLKERGLQMPSLVVSDTHKGLITAIRTSFIGASWQWCNVHFMRNILVHIPRRDKTEFAGKLKEIWLAPSAEAAKERAAALLHMYAAKYPKAIEALEDGLEDALSFYAFPKLDSRKIASTNMLERLNEEIRRRIRVVGIFPNPDSYLCLIITFLMEYTEDWSVSRDYLSEKSIRTLLPLAA